MSRPMLSRLVERILGRPTANKPAPDEITPAPADMTVTVEPGRPGLEAFKAALPGQVGQIAEIAPQHHRAAERAIWKCVSEGFDMHTLSLTLSTDCGLDPHLASAVAVRQCNLARLLLEHARRKDLGITHAIWMYNGAGRRPCTHHRVLNNKKYRISEGAELNGQRVWPGTDPECMCMSRSVIAGLED